MKTLFKSLVIVFFLALSLSARSTHLQQAAAQNSDPHNKIRICHATDSHTNPYTNPEVDQDAVDGDLGNDNGQGDHYMEHNGPVWAPGIADHSWGDIIPPIAGVHEGKNWTAEGQAFWNNNCNIPGASPSVDPSPSATPSATPSPTPSSSPSSSPESSPGTGGPSVRNGISLHNNDLRCEETTFDAKADVFNFGSPVRDVLVKFTFNGENKEARTNNDGRAQVSFPLTNGTVIAQVENYGTYTHEIKKPVECKDVLVDPDTSRSSGQVLGASTLADTGNQSLYFTLILISLGAVITSVAGYGIYQEK